MTQEPNTRAITLMAANDNPPGTQNTRAALHGLVVLMARAEARAVARRGAANAANAPAKKKVRT